MPEYSRRGFLAMSGLAIAGLSGCSQSNTSKKSRGEDSLRDVVHEIEYRQRQRVDEFNDSFGENIFDEDSLELSHNPTNLENSDGDIDYQISLQTGGGYSIDDLEGLNTEERYSPLEEVVGRLIFENLHVPLKGIRGKAFIDEQSSNEYRRRLGNIDVKIQDNIEETVEVKVSDKKADEFWSSIDHALEEDENNMKVEASRQIKDYASERI